MQSRLGLLESLAAFPVLLVPCFISALKLIDLCHPLYRLRLFRGWIFLLPALPLFANASYVFLCLLKIVYACSNFHIALRGSTIHWPSPGHQRCWASSNTLRNSLRRARDRQAPSSSLQARRSALNGPQKSVALRPACLYGAPRLRQPLAHLFDETRVGFHPQPL